jgi:hypothetical protein
MYNTQSWGVHTGLNVTIGGDNHHNVRMSHFPFPTISNKTGADSVIYEQACRINLLLNCRLDERCFPPAWIRIGM